MMVLSINGLYNWDNTIFDDFVTPDEVDKETAIAQIMLQGSDFGLIYPDFDIMKTMIGVWSKTHQYKWEKLAKILNLEYDPIENYNRLETWDDDRKATSTSNRTVSGSADGHNTTVGSTKLDVSAYDEGGNYSPKDKTTVDDTLTSHDSATTTDRGDSTDTDNATHTGVTRGNIGVTTTQKMIKEEREVANFNIYEVIADDFVSNFCILVY